MLLVIQPQSLYQQSQQETDFRTGGTSLKVELVEDQEKICIVIGSEPLPGLCKYWRVDFPSQHRIQHAYVRDQDVGRTFLHVPSGDHFVAVCGGKEKASIRIAVQSRRFLCQLHLRHGLEQTSKFPLPAFVFVLIRSRMPMVPRDWCGRSVLPEEDSVAIEEPVHARSGGIGIKSSPKARQLVFDERIHRVQDHCADGRCAFVVFATPLRQIWRTISILRQGSVLKIGVFIYGTA